MLLGYILNCRAFCEFDLLMRNLQNEREFQVKVGNVREFHFSALNNVIKSAVEVYIPNTYKISEPQNAVQQRLLHCSQNENGGS